MEGRSTQVNPTCPSTQHIKVRKQGRDGQELGQEDDDGHAQNMAESALPKWHAARTWQNQRRRNGQNRNEKHWELMDRNNNGNHTMDKNRNGNHRPETKKMMLQVEQVDAG